MYAATRFASLGTLLFRLRSRLRTTFRPAAPDDPAAVRLGTVHFPRSGSPAAQREFIRGIALLHSFTYEAAARAFLGRETVPQPEYDTRLADAIRFATRVFNANPQHPGAAH